MYIEFDRTLQVLYHVNMTLTYTFMIEKSADGYYAEVPGIQGVYAQGDTETEVVANIKDVLEMTLKDMKERGEILPLPQAFPSISFSAVSVAV